MKRRRIEGYWDCKYCSTKKIRGGTTDCPNCGKTRDTDTTFYLEGKHNYVPPKIAAIISRNPDWVCEYCNSLNSDNDKECHACGAPRTTQSLNYFENKRRHQIEAVIQEFDTEEKEKIEDKTEKEDDVSENYNSIYSSLRKKLNFFKNFKFNTETLMCILLGLFSLFAIIGTVYLFAPKEIEISVLEMSWKREIGIERYQTVQESKWYLPEGARILYQRDEIYDYESVFDHNEIKSREVRKTRKVGTEEYLVGMEDLGNGYFDEITETSDVYETYYETETYEEPVYRKEPIFRTKYYYEIDKWLYERTETSSGTDKEPYWCEVILADDERISSKNEFYYVEGVDKKRKSYKYKLKYEEWKDIKVDQKIKLKTSILGDATLVE